MGKTISQYLKTFSQDSICNTKHAFRGFDHSNLLAFFNCSILVRVVLNLKHILLNLMQIVHILPLY